MVPVSQDDRSSKLSEVTELKTQLIKLSEQVTALATLQSSKHQSQMPRCFIVIELDIFSGNVSVSAFLNQHGTIAMDNWAHRCP